MEKPKINNRKDILLLLLYSPGKNNAVNEPIAGRTRLVKMVFLFKNEIFASFKNPNVELNLDNFYNFFAWDYGPFSKEVYDDLNFFILKDFIESSSANESLPNSENEAFLSPDLEAEYEKWEAEIDIGDEEIVIGYEEEAFTLTNKGIDFTKKFYDLLNGKQKDILKDFKARLTSTSLRSILRYVYKTYPKEAEKSKIADKVF